MVARLLLEPVTKLFAFGTYSQARARKTERTAAVFKLNASASDDNA